ncbi:MAG: hypothetical protein JXR03_20725 [Cyclobacteriaceae bacterium]
MKAIIGKLLAKGEEHYTDDSDKRRVRIFNLVGWGLVSIAIPPILLITHLEGNTRETYAVATVLISFLIALVLNRNGQNQLAVVVGTIVSMVSIFYTIYMAKAQTGAPYGYLAMAFSFVILIKGKKKKIFLIVISLALFIVTNFYQLKNLPFSEIEYLAIIFMLFIVLLVMMYYDRLMIGYQFTIKEQSASLLKLEKEKHEKEILLKQKDLEMILASSSARDDLTQNLTNQLKEVASSDNIKKNLSKVITDLNSHQDLISRQTLIHQNIAEINAEFYDRLLSEFPDLTKAERELCAYLKLSLSNKEIASLKNSTENSVNVSKARLRKKLSLDSNKALSAFLLNY